MGTVLFPFFLNRLIQYSCLFLNKILVLISSAFLIYLFILFLLSSVLLFLYITVQQWRIKYEQIGGGSPKHLNIFVIFKNLLLALHYTHEYTLLLLAIHYTHEYTLLLLTVPV